MPHSIKRKRWQADELAMIAILICVSIVSVLIGSFTVSTLEMEKAGRGYYGKNTMSVITDGTQRGSVSKILEFIQGQDNIFASVEQMYLKRIAFKGKVTGIPVISGRFFTEEDFFCGKKLAVLGRAPTTSGVELVSENGIQYVKVNEVLYEVIGRVGYSLPSAVDQMIFINLDGEDATKQYCRQLILSYYGSAKVETLYPQLSALLEQGGYSSVPAEMPDADTNLMNFFDLGTLNSVMLAFSFFSVILATLPISAHWVGRRMKSIAVRRFLGFSLGSIVSNIMLRYFILFNIGFAGGYLLIALASSMKTISLYAFFSSATLLSYLVALSFNLLIALPAVFLSMRIEPGDALRRL